MKAQSSVEFIMNYSWMLAIVGVVLAVLFGLGFFSPSSWGFSSGQSGFGDLAPMDTGWKVETDGTFVIRLRNSAGADLKLWEVTATLGTNKKSYNYGGFEIFSGDDSEIINIPNVSSSKEGDPYKIFVELKYGTEDINFTSQGKVWGIVGK